MRSNSSAKASTIENSGLPVYADNTAALAGGLIAGQMYRTATGVLKIVYWFPYLCEWTFEYCVMNYNMSFQERAQLGLEELSNQSPVTLEMAREQAERLKIKSVSKNKKKRA